jgi:hypothetical protein
MAKKISQKNTEALLAQQRTELDNMRESLPMEMIRAAEDKLLYRCIDIVESSLDFASLGFTKTGDLDEDQLPLEWACLSPEDKARKIRLAKYACLPSSDVPYGTKAAFATATAIIKSRALEKSGTKVFNMEVSSFPAPSPLTQGKDVIDADYEVLDVD